MEGIDLLADPGFNVEDFLVGARVAFEMILVPMLPVNAKRKIFWARRPMTISLDDDREAAGHEMEETLVGIHTAILSKPLWMDRTPRHGQVPFRTGPCAARQRGM